MASQDPIIFDPKTLLWRARGYHWDFEFINTPAFLTDNNWWKLTKDTFSMVDPNSNEQIIYGTVDFRSQNQKKWYLAAYYLDKSQVDWTSRCIRHFLIWFPSEILSKEQLCQSIPMNWLEQIFEKTSYFLYQDEIFRLSEKQLKELSHNGQDLYSYLQKRYDKEVNSFALKPKSLNLLSSEWRNINLVKE